MDTLVHDLLWCVWIRQAVALYRAAALSERLPHTDDFLFYT